MIARVSAAVLAALLVAGCSAADIDLRAAAAGIARSACRGIGSCSTVCDDGSTLDGRPVTARCPR